MARHKSILYTVIAAGAVGGLAFAMSNGIANEVKKPINVVTTVSGQLKNNNSQNNIALAQHNKTKDTKVNNKIADASSTSSSIAKIASDGSIDLFANTSSTPNATSSATGSISNGQGEHTISVTNNGNADLAISSIPAFNSYNKINSSNNNLNVNSDITTSQNESINHTALNQPTSNVNNSSDSARLSNLQQGVGTIVNGKSQIVNNLNSLSQGLNGLKQNLNNTSQNLNNFKNDFNGFTNSVNDANGTLNSINGNVVNSLQTINSINGCIDNINGSIQNINKAIGTVISNAASGSKPGSLDNLKLLATLKSNINTINSNIQSIKSYGGTLSNNLNSTINSINKLSSQGTAINNNVISLLKDLNSARNNAVNGLNNVNIMVGAIVDINNNILSIGNGILSMVNNL